MLFSITEHQIIQQITVGDIWAMSPEKWIFAYIIYMKTKMQISCAVTAQLISIFVLATQIVQFLFFLNLQFQASSLLLWLFGPVYIGNPENRFLASWLIMIMDHPNMT